MTAIPLRVLRAAAAFLHQRADAGPPGVQAETLSGDVNKGLAHLRATGRFDEIIAQYTR